MKLDTLAERLMDCHFLNQNIQTPSWHVVPESTRDYWRRLAMRAMGTLGVTFERSPDPRYDAALEALRGLTRWTEDGKIIAGAIVAALDAAGEGGTGR